MLRDFTQQTTWGRVLVALVVGDFAGALGITLFDVPDCWSIWSQDIRQIIWYWAGKYFFNLSFFSGVLFLLGTPVWFLAHKLGFRTWASALLAGFGLTVSFVLLVGLAVLFFTDMHLNNEITPFGNLIFIYLVAVPVLGALIALTIWRIAYRRPTPC